MKLTSGVSRDLAQRILKGDACDVFAPSSPAVIDEDLMNKKVAGSDKEAATWYVVFSANEMVVITAKGNPLGIRQVSDLAKPQVKFARVTGEKDLATGRTIEFLKRATAQEGKPELAQKIVDSAPADPAKPTNVPGTVNAVKDGPRERGRRLLFGGRRRAQRRRHRPLSRQRQSERGDPQRGDRSRARRATRARRPRSSPSCSRRKHRRSSRTPASRRWCRRFARAPFPHR